MLGDVRAGEWHLAADCFVIQPVDVRFEILWRAAAGGDTPIVMWEQRFEPSERVQIPQTHDFRAVGPAVSPVAEGDQLVFRYTGLTGATNMLWIPNGEGARAMARIPFIDLP